MTKRTISSTSNASRPGTGLLTRGRWRRDSRSRTVEVRDLGCGAGLCDDVVGPPRRCLGIPVRDHDDRHALSEPRHARGPRLHRSPPGRIGGSASPPLAPHIHLGKDTHELAAHRAASTYGPVPIRRSRIHNAARSLRPCTPNTARAAYQAASKEKPTRANHPSRQDFPTPAPRDRYADPFARSMPLAGTVY